MMHQEEIIGRGWTERFCNSETRSRSLRRLRSTMRAAAPQTALKAD